MFSRVVLLPSLLALLLAGVVSCISAPTLDPAFGVGGVVVVDRAGGRDAFYAVRISGDGGRAYAAGPTASYPGAPTVPPPTPLDTGLDYGLLCVSSSSGARCPGFGDARGLVTVDFGNDAPTRSPTDVAADVVVQEDGRIVVVGQSNYGTLGTGNENLTFSASRHDPLDGSLDVPYFGNDRTTGAFDGRGRSSVDVDPNGVNDEAFRGALLPGGRVVSTGFSNPGNVSGTGSSSNFNFGVVVIRSDGTPDPSFGGFEGDKPGTSRIDLGPGWDDRPRGIVVLPTDGSMVLAGRTRPAGSPVNQFLGAAVKLRAAGDVDTTFGLGSTVRVPGTLVGSGAVLLSPPGRNGSTILNDIVASRECSDPDRADDCALFLGGQTTTWDSGTSGTSAFLVAKIGPDGAVDRSWADDGYLVHKIAGTGTSETFSLAMDLRRHLLYVVGRVTSADGLRNSPAVLRIRARNGRLDNSFGSNGGAVVPLGEGNTGFFRGAVLVEGATALLAAGEISRNTTSTAAADFLLARLLV